MTKKTSFLRRALALCIVHCALCISSAYAALNITASATAVKAGDPTPVTATISGGTVAHLYLVYQVSGTWNTTEMTSVSATEYTGFIPPLIGAVSVVWYVTDGNLRTRDQTTTLAANPDYGRYHDGVAGETKTWVVGPRAQGQLDIPAEQQDMVNGWKYDGSSHSNLVAQAPNGSQWKASGVGIAISLENIGYPGVDTAIGMDYPSLYFQNIPSTEMPFIRSPKLEGGVGTIDFRTILIGSTIVTSELTLQIAYTDEEPTETDWIDYAVYKYGTRNGSVFSKICHEVLNDYGVTYVRIMRTGHNDRSVDLTSGRLAVDNICITKPAADVGIIEMLKNPGYPSADQDILMRCAVTNCVEETPAINRRVTVKYQYVPRDGGVPVAGAWSSADMVYQGKDSATGLDWYEGVIPTQKVGYVWYYYQVDYDGYAWSGTLEGGAATESISPAYWDAGADTHDRPAAGTKFQVRPFRSRYGRMSLVSQTSELSVPEMTLVDDEQWLAVIPVKGVTVVSNFFVGYGYYEDDAAAYDEAPVVWGEDNPDALSDPTLAGYLDKQDAAVTNRLVALNEKSYEGFYLYRFSSNDKDVDAAQDPEGDRRYDYIVKKAVYQDFDDWTASPDYFESSLGGLKTLTFAEDFDGNASASATDIRVSAPWEPDGYATTETKDEEFDDVDDAEVSDSFNSRGKGTPGGFLRTGSRIIANRRAKIAETRVNKTLALGENGQIENTSDSLPYGIEKIEFEARASIDDRNFAIYKNGVEWTLPQYIHTQWQLTDMAPSKPYFSIILLYQPDLWVGASWYELRIIQTDILVENNSSFKERVNLELWHHPAAGEETKVAWKENISGHSLATAKRNVNVSVKKVGNDLIVRVHLGTTSTTPDNSAATELKHTGGLANNSSPTGTIGFGVFDAVPNITELKVGPTYNNGDYIASLSASKDNWFPGGTRPDGQNRWTITSTAITRTVQPQTIAIYAADCVGGEYQAMPDTASLVATREVNSFSMTSMTIPFKVWNRKFVQICYESGDGGVVLDKIKYHPWRAATRYDTDKASVDGVNYLNWTDTDQQENWLDRVLDTTGETMLQHWAVLEGWVESKAGRGNGVNFVRSRANTNLVQGVVSPELTNGLGSCSFAYDASGGRVVYGIECSDEGNYHAWTPVAVFMSEAGESGERYAKVGKYFDGRIRIRVYGAADVGELLEKNPDCGYDPAWQWTASTAELFVDKLRVKNFPEDKDDNAWNAYNLRITDNEDFADAGLVYNNSGKSCFFNNSPTEGVYSAEAFDEDDPYLESPPLRGVGVGEIAFQYRLVPGTAAAGVDGRIVIKVAPDRDTPLAQWKTITNLVVSADGTAFVKFDNEKIFDEKNFVVRFYNSKEAGTPRFVIDNVLITAPARASFEFEYVKLLPVQPLAGSETAVEAKIMREIMSPKNIEIYVSYHIYDTNNVSEAWGVTNWFNPGTSPKVRLEAVTGVEKVYRTPEGGGIPDNFSVNDVVEFVVWGVHDAIDINAGDSPIIQDKETFELPEWYQTVDLEKMEVVPMDLNVDKEAEGWSPYFWVFSCPPGTFFVNEYNYWRTASAQVDRGSAEYIEFAGYAGTDIGGWKLMVVHNDNRNGYEDMEYVIPAGTRLPADTETGWGFFVWGDSCSSDSFTIDSSPPRENVPFTVDAAFPDSADRFDRHLGSYAGVLVYRPNGMIEDRVRFGTNTATDFNGEEDIWGPASAGRKDSNRSDSISRISKASEDDEEEEGMAGSTVGDFVWRGENVSVGQTPGAINVLQVLADVTGNAPVVVVFKDPEGHEITDAAILAWIAGYNAEQSDIDALRTMAKFNEAYLLNLDLTKSCAADLKITSIRIADGAVYLGVQLSRTEDGTPVGTRAINGTLKLLGRADLTTGTFTALQPDAFDSTFTTGNAVNIEYELPGSNPPKFFKVIVE